MNDSLQEIGHVNNFFWLIHTDEIKFDYINTIILIKLQDKIKVNLQIPYQIKK